MFELSLELFIRCKNNVKIYFMNIYQKKYVDEPWWRKLADRQTDEFILSDLIS